jgi:hypothetical protein
MKKKEKNCARCQKVKPLNDFKKRTEAKDGRMSTCLICYAKDQEKHKERQRTYNWNPLRKSPPSSIEIAAPKWWKKENERLLKNQKV